MKKTRIRHYDVKLNKPGLEHGHIKFVFLSDMHNCLWGNRGEDLIRAVDEQNPDLVLCGGDMLVAHPNVSVEIASDFIKALSRRHRIYYAYGNHEYRLRLYPETYGTMYEDYMKSLEGHNICFLDNTCKRLTVNGIPVGIYGLTIERKYYKRFTRLKMPVGYIESLIGRPRDKQVNILLAHTPKYMSEYFEWGADVSLSGHYHGGVMQLGRNRGLLSPDPALFPYNAHGSFEKNGKTAIISAGIGEHTIPVRIHDPRELVAVDLYINCKGK